MEGVEVDVIRKIARGTRAEAVTILQEEGAELKTTKSLLNILHNLVEVGSIPVTERKRAFFNERAQFVWELLSAKRSLAWKKRALEANIAVVINIATSCPIVD